jgi:vacuolar-type H+-ATPase subunit E/Vma4
MAAPPRTNAKEKSATTTRARRYHKKPLDPETRIVHDDWMRAKKSAEESWRVTAQRAALKVRSSALKDVEDAMQTYVSSRDATTPKDQREILDKIAAHLARMDDSLLVVKEEEDRKRRFLEELTRDDEKTYMCKKLALLEFKKGKAERGFTTAAVSHDESRL